MKTRVLALSLLALCVGLSVSARWLRRPVPPTSAPAPKLVAAIDSPPPTESHPRRYLGLAEVLREIGREPDAQSTEERLQALLASFALADLPGALAEASEDRGNPWSEIFCARLLRHWAEIDPHAAAAALGRATLPSASQSAALEGVAIEWAAQDLPAALAWARQLPDPAERRSALLTLAYEASRNSPRQALAIASGLDASTPAQNRLITHAAAQWAASEPAAAAAWAQQLADPDLREGSLAAIATAWADRDPIAAGTLALRSLAPGRVQDDAVVGIVARWAQQQPAAAAEWVNGFPPGDLRNAATATLSSASEMAGSAL